MGHIGTFLQNVIRIKGKNALVDITNKNENVYRNIFLCFGIQGYSVL